MFYTLTINPAIDYNISTDNKIKSDIVNRTHSATFTANGKGINVSNVLDYFNVKSNILGFFGGFSGHFIVDELKKQNFEILPIFIEDPSRINVFLNDSTAEYNFVNNGPVVNRNCQIKMLNLIDELTDLEYLCISGSLAQGIHSDYYDEILHICQNKKTKVILDISSKKLSELLSFKPFLIKPNNEEIKDIFGWELNTKEDAIKILKKLNCMGAQNILLTMGQKGIYFYDSINIYYANTVSANVISSACAGDSCLAAFLSVYLKDKSNIVKALKLACATGANVCESRGIGVLDKIDYFFKAANCNLVEI